MCNLLVAQTKTACVLNNADKVVLTTSSGSRHRRSSNHGDAAKTFLLGGDYIFWSLDLNSVTSRLALFPQKMIELILVSVFWHSGRAVTYSEVRAFVLRSGRPTLAGGHGECKRNPVSFLPRVCPTLAAHGPLPIAG